jgi:hypothetical protein
MSPISRRDFILKTLKPVSIGRNVATTEAAEFVIGRIVDFPLGEKRLQELNQVAIESLPEGLRAQSTENTNQFYSIKLNQIGELIVNRMELWPASKVFSILTNESVYLDMSSEDKA